MSDNDEVTSNSSGAQNKPITMKKAHTCPTCGLTVSDKSYLTKHLRTHTGEKPFECNDCGMTFRRKYHVKNHILALHSSDKLPTKNCTICQKLIAVIRMKTHMKTHTRPYPCKDCGINFGAKLDLESHRRHRHTDDSLREKAKCSVCHKVFLATSMEQHLKRHARLKPFKCLQCGKAFSEKGELNFPMKCVHKTGDPLKCDHCDKILYRMNHLTSHMRVHTGEKPYQCTFCDMRHTHRVSLVYHMRKYRTGEEPYFCSQCDRTFTCRNTLQRHEFTHSEEKTFKCAICPKTFLLRDSIHRHMKTHQESRPYKCTKCPKAFKNNSHCKRHIGTCRAATQKRNSESADDAETTIFRPVMEQFGPHQMKKCSVFIKRVSYIEHAVARHYQSVGIWKT